MGGVTPARLILEVVGNFTFHWLLFSPIPTFWRIVKKKSTEGFHPYPYLAAVMNYMLWIFYASLLDRPDSILLMTTKSIGLCMQMIYLTMFFIFTNNKHRRAILLFTLVELVLLAAIVAISILCLHATTMRSLLFGIFVSEITMHASPLSNLRTVLLETKTSEFMPIGLCVAGFANSVIRCCHAFLNLKTPMGVTIAVVNGIGAEFGLIQLIMYYVYYKVKQEDRVKRVKLN